MKVINLFETEGRLRNLIVLNLLPYENSPKTNKSISRGMLLKTVFQISDQVKTPFKNSPIIDVTVSLVIPAIMCQAPLFQL